MSHLLALAARAGSAQPVGNRAQYVRVDRFRERGIEERHEGISLCNHLATIDLCYSTRCLRVLRAGRISYDDYC